MSEVEKIVFVMMPIIAITCIVFGCIMGKYFDAIYLGLTSVVYGIIWFNWCLYESRKLKVM